VLGRAHFTRMEETRVNTFIGTHILYDKVGTTGQRAIYFSHIPLCKSKCNAPNLVLIQAFHYDYTLLRSTCTTLTKYQQTQHQIMRLAAQSADRHI